MFPDHVLYMARSNLPVVIETSSRVGRNSVADASLLVQGELAFPDVLDILGFTAFGHRVELST